MSTFCFDNYTHMINEDLISCTYKPPKVYFESWDNPYEGLAPDEDSVVVVRDKHIAKYTKLKCAGPVTETAAAETVFEDDRMDCRENGFDGGSIENTRGFYEYAVEEYDIETFKKRKYKVLFEEETEISINDYNLMSYFVDVESLGIPPERIFGRALVTDDDNRTLDSNTFEGLPF